jgi:hypothetical protein
MHFLSYKDTVSDALKVVHSTGRSIQDIEVSEVHALYISSLKDIQNNTLCDSGGICYNFSDIKRDESNASLHDFVD